MHIPDHFWYTGIKKWSGSLTFYEQYNNIIRLIVWKKHIKERIIKKIIDSKIIDTDFKYLFIDEIQIFEKDIKTSNRINDKALSERVQKFIINNFGTVISVKKYIII